MDFVWGDFSSAGPVSASGGAAVYDQFTAGCVENKGQRELLRLILRGSIPAVPD